MQKTDTFTLADNGLTRALEALQVAKHQVRLAQSATSSWQIEAALTEIEDDLSDCLARIHDALESDIADAEESGEVERERRSWFPRAA